MINPLLLNRLSDEAFEDLADKVFLERDRRLTIKAETMPAPDWSSGKPEKQADAVFEYRKKHECSLSLALKVVRKHW